MGQYFIDDSEIRSREISSGIKIKVVSGEKLMLSFVEIPEGAGMSEHSHPHEQAGIVLEGEIEIVIGTESRKLKCGESYFIPARIPHMLRPWKYARVLDVFSPPREDYL
jgi:quercetin dioxygenase-like cupin family protein